MICVSLTSKTHAALFEDMRRAKALADLIEVRLDLLQERPNIEAILRAAPLPVIATCRPKDEGGGFEGDEAERIALLQRAIDLGADYVDVELHSVAKISRRGRSRLIVSHHDFTQTPTNLLDTYKELRRTGADIVKLACMAQDASDNARIFRLLQKARTDGQPTIGLCMGEFGIASRVLAPRFGGYLTFASLDESSAAAPGQVPAAVLRSLYRYEKIGPDTRLFCVIGDPIAHSMSPAIHNAAFAETGMNAVYVLFRVLDPIRFLEETLPLGFEGVSVTIPHKERVMEVLDEIDPVARRIGAVNTIAIRDGKRLGWNTDWTAAVQAIEKAAARRRRGEKLTGKRAVILGAGGAARAIAFGLVEAGASIVILNRTVERAERLAEDIRKELEKDARNAANVEVAAGPAPPDPQLAPACDILVNATSVGMSPKVDESPVDKSFLRPEMIVFDAVYNPLRTKLIQEAQAVGCEIATGLEMFVGQAVAQFELWTGRKAPVETMAAVVRERLEGKAAHRDAEQT